MELPKVNEPTRDEINKYHEIFMQEIEDLFDRYKAAYGWKDKKLVIK
jgi:hypothetical protein